MIATTGKNFLLAMVAGILTKFRIADLTDEQFKALNITEVKVNGQGLSQKNRDRVQELAAKFPKVKFEQISQLAPVDDIAKHYNAVLNYQPKKQAVIELSKEQQAAIATVIKATNKSSVSKFIRNFKTK